MSPGEPLWYANSSKKLDAIDNIRSSGIVQEALHFALETNGILDLQSLIAQSV